MNSTDEYVMDSFVTFDKVSDLFLATAKPDILTHTDSTPTR